MFTIGSFLKQLKEMVRSSAAGAADSVLVVGSSGLTVRNPVDLVQLSAFFGFVDEATAEAVVGFTIPANYSSAKYLVNILRDADTPLYETVELNLVNKDGTWNITTLGAVGDNTAVDFSVGSSEGVGQIKYTSTTVAGHSADTSAIAWKLISYL